MQFKTHKKIYLSFLISKSLKFRFPEVDPDGGGHTVAVVSEALVDALVLVFWSTEHDRALVGQLHHTIIVPARVEVYTVLFPPIAVQGNSTHKIVIKYSCH